MNEQKLRESLQQISPPKEMRNRILHAAREKQEIPVLSYRKTIAVAVVLLLIVNFGVLASYFRFGEKLPTEPAATADGVTYAQDGSLEELQREMLEEFDHFKFRKTKSFLEDDENFTEVYPTLAGFQMIDQYGFSLLNHTAAENTLVCRYTKYYEDANGKEVLTNQEYIVWYSDKRENPSNIMAIVASTAKFTKVELEAAPVFPSDVANEIRRDTDNWDNNRVLFKRVGADASDCFAMLQVADQSASVVSGIPQSSILQQVGVSGSLAGMTTDQDAQGEILNSLSIQNETMLSYYDTWGEICNSLVSQIILATPGETTDDGWLPYWDTLRGCLAPDIAPRSMDYYSVSLLCKAYGYSVQTETMPLGQLDDTLKGSVDSCTYTLDEENHCTVNLSVLGEALEQFSVQFPSLRQGMTRMQVERIMEELGLPATQYIVYMQVYCPDQAANTLCNMEAYPTGTFYCNMDPSKIEETAIRLYFSSGPLDPDGTSGNPDAKTPQELFVGKTFAQAKKLQQHYQLTCSYQMSDETQYDSSLPQGTILSANWDEEMDWGCAISLVVNSNTGEPPQIVKVMPDVIGLQSDPEHTWKISETPTLEQAMREVDAFYVIRYVYDSSVPEGHVVSASCKAGEPLNEMEVVNVFVSASQEMLDSQKALSDFIQSNGLEKLEIMLGNRKGQADPAYEQQLQTLRENMQTRWQLEELPPIQLCSWNTKEKPDTVRKAECMCMMQYRENACMIFVLVNHDEATCDEKSMQTGNGCEQRLLHGTSEYLIPE